MPMSKARCRFLLEQVVKASLDGDWSYSCDLVSMYQPSFWRYFRSGAGRSFSYRGLRFCHLHELVTWVVDNAFLSARPPHPDIARRFCEHMSDMCLQSLQ